MAVRSGRATKKTGARTPAKKSTARAPARATKKSAPSAAAAKKAASPPPKKRTAKVVDRRVCAGDDCTTKFEAKRSNAKYCSGACRERARHRRSGRRPKKTAAAESAATSEPDRDQPETGLIAAIRTKLEAADAVDTFEGQLALQLAQRIMRPDETGISSLSKELRTLVAAATGVTVGDGEASGTSKPVPDEPEDEVTKARKARAEAREAAGRA